MKTKLLWSLVLFSYALFGQRTVEDHVQSMSMAHELNQPESSFQASADLNNISSINKSGDLNASIPLIVVKGKELQLPINLNYQAGIKIDQKSSPVGLGWNISFGSIIRDYGAFEPDYYETTVETDMINVESDAVGDLSKTTRANVLHRHKNLPYQGLDGSDNERMTPDLYHINLPGQGGNTFWNMGSAGAAHNFTWEEFQNWTVEHTPETFTFNQEISRINEINNPNASNSAANSFAAAIIIPPYVQDRDFKQLVFGDAPPTGYDWGVLEEDRIISYRDFGEFIITTEDGTQYVFGRPLRGQKYLMDNDPFWSLVHGKTGAIDANTPTSVEEILAQDGSVLGEFWKIDFIREWLLTEVRSAGYRDANQNCIADDGDEGDWIRIEYTEPTQQEDLVVSTNITLPVDVPKHREWSSFSRTDKESSLMTERAYVTKIVTPVEQYDFTLSERFDVDHDYFSVPLNNGGIGSGTNNHWYANNNIGSHDTKVKYPVEVMKYDQIQHSVRVTRLITQSSGDGGVVIPTKTGCSELDPLPQYELLDSSVVSTIEFNYAAKGSAEELAVSDYLILDNSKTENNIGQYEPNAELGFVFDIEDYDAGDARGKTTLLGLTIYPEDDLLSSDAKKFSFEYGFNPSFNPIHKHEILKMEYYPSIRCSYSRARFVPDKTFIPTLSPFSTVNNVVGTAFANQLTTDNSSSTCMTNLGYYDDPSTSQFEGDAWSLTKITLPEGGSISFDYEKDETDFTTTFSNILDVDGLVPNRLPSIMNYNSIAAAKAAVQSKINTDENNGLKTLTPTFSTPEEFFGLRLKSKTLDDDNGNISTIDYDYGTGYHTSIPASYWQNTLSAFSGFTQYQSVNQDHLGNYQSLLKAQTLVYFQDPDYGLVLAWPGGPIRENDFSTFVYTLQSNVRLDHSVDDDTHFYDRIDEIRPDGGKTSSHYGQVNQTNTDFDPVHQTTAYLKGFFMDEGDVVEMVLNQRDPTKQVVLKKQEYFNANNSNPVWASINTYEASTRDYKSCDFIAKEFLTVEQHAFNYDNDDLIAIMTGGDDDHYIDMTINIDNYRYATTSALEVNTANQALTKYNAIDANGNFPTHLQFQGFTLPTVDNFTRYLSYHIKQTEQQVVDYHGNPGGSDAVSKTTYYHYDNIHLAQPTRIEKTTSENPDLFQVTHYVYPEDYTNLGGFIGAMKTANIIKPIEIVESELDKSNNTYVFTDAIYNRYVESGTQLGMLEGSYLLENEATISMPNFSFSNRSGTGYNEIPPLGNKSTFYPSNLYGTSEVDHTFYENRRQLKSVQTKGAPLTSFKYGYGDAYPTVQIVGAQADEVTTQNFEEPLFQHSSDAYCGDQSYNLFGDNPALLRTNIKENVKQDGDYTLSFHYKSSGLNGTAVVMTRLFRYPNQPNQVLITNHMPLFYMNDTQGEWKMFNETLDIPALKTANGIPLSEEVGVRIQLVNYDQNVPILVDDWRFYPSEAQLTTYTYKPLRGVSSITDARGETQNFTYDGFGRLIETKDAEGKLLQTTQYNTVQP